MATERIPNFLAHALIAFDGRFPACEEETGCANSGSGAGAAGESGVQGSSVTLVSAVNSTSAPVLFRHNTLWKRLNVDAIKNPREVKAPGSELQNNPDTEDALEGFRRGFRHLHPGSHRQDI